MKSRDDLYVNKKEDIIHCSIQLFSTKGFHETSMDDICTCAGITKGTLYYYINSKDELLYDIHERFINVIIEQTVNKLKEMGTQTFKDKLIAIFSIHMQIMNDYREEIAVFFKEMDSLSKEKFDLIALKREKYYRIVHNVINDGIKNGEFINIDPDIASLSFFGMSNWMYQWFKPSGRYSHKEVAALMGNIFLNGILA